MSASVKYGIIGGIIFTLIIATGFYLLEQSVRNNTAVVYLKELVLIISVVAAIKGARDANRSEALELRTGMKAGLTTVIIICAFILSFDMVYPFTISETESASINDMGYAEYFRRKPVTDTTQADFVRAKQISDSALKVGDLGLASLNLRKAKIIHPADSSLNPQIKQMDKLMYQKSREVGFLFKINLVTSIFPQIVMGLLISFVTSMIFRYKQQSEM